jgi:hypothetical protein
VLRQRVTAARAKVAAATAALFLVGSAGGFALAHAVSDDEGAGFPPGQGVSTRPDGGPGGDRDTDRDTDRDAHHDGPGDDQDASGPGRADS